MYVDPSTGPLLTQLLLSAGVGTIVGFRAKIARLWKRVTRDRDDQPPGTPPSGEREPTRP